MFDNITTLETALKAVKKYDLPDGFHSVSGRYDDVVSIEYALGVWDVPEMEQIARNTNTWKAESGRQYVVGFRTEIDGVPVQVLAHIPKEAYVED